MFVCPVCKKSEEIVADADGTIPDPSSSILRCSDCDSRIAYGVAMPRVVVSPDDGDGRMIVLSIGGAHFVLDREFARTIGQNLASL